MSAYVRTLRVRFAVCLAGAMVAATVAPAAIAQPPLKNVVMHEAPKTLSYGVMVTECATLTGHIVCYRQQATVSLTDVIVGETMSIVGVA